MVEIILSPAPQGTRPKAKAPLEGVVGQALDYLREHPSGVTVEELASIASIPAATARKVIGIIATVTSKVTPLITENDGARVRLLLTHSPKGTITAARFEVAAPELEGHDPCVEGDPNQKPTYTLGLADMAEVQRAWKVYQATGHAFWDEDAARLAPLCAKFPYLFTQNATKTGLLPTMAMFTVARNLEQYASLGRLPGTIETPIAIITFEGGA